MPEQFLTSAVIVAAGSGSRLGESTAGGTGPKALRLLGGRSLVRWSAERMISGGAGEIIVVVPEGYSDQFAASIGEQPVPVKLTVGGATRQESVLNGLALLDEAADVVLVHDAARPLVPVDVIRGVIDAVRGGAEAVVPAVAVHDSIREVDDAGSHVVDRSRLRAMQTPQGFRPETLRAAHEQVSSSTFTDDAAVCEACGHPVTLVEGSRMSLKITEPVDFAFAEALMNDAIASTDLEA